MAMAILVVDDEEAIRGFVQRILELHGFTVLAAADGLDAIEKVESFAKPIDLLVTDIRMPRMDGVSLGRWVAKAYPEVPILYISGYPFDLEGEKPNLPVKVCAFLPKPFTPKALIETVRQCLPSTKAAVVT